MGESGYGLDDVGSFTELDRVLERLGAIRTPDGKTYDADEAEDRVDRIESYVQQHGVDDRVQKMVGDITPAGGLRDTVKRLLTDTYD